MSSMDRFFHLPWDLSDGLGWVGGVVGLGCVWGGVVGWWSGFGVGLGTWGEVRLHHADALHLLPGGRPYRRNQAALAVPAPLPHHLAGGPLGCRAWSRGGPARISCGRLWYQVLIVTQLNRWGRGLSCVTQCLASQGRG